MELREQLREKIEEINSLDFNLEETEKELEIKKKELTDAALELRLRRQDAVAPFEQKITEMMREVGYSECRFQGTTDSRWKISQNGGPTGSSFCSVPTKILPHRIYPGLHQEESFPGLCYALNHCWWMLPGLPTLIFDEIDTGVSGDIAERVGNIISRMAEKMQIINVTHLPQVASKGENHFLVYKTEDDHSTVTQDQTSDS